MRFATAVAAFLVLLITAGAAGAQVPPPRIGTNSTEPDFAPWREVRLNLPSTKEAQAMRPFKIFDNVYYVGLKEYGSYLITTSQGLILIDATYDHTAPLILDNIRALGFDPKNVKYLLITHAHGDHAAGTKVIKDATGARVVMAAGDWTLYETPARGRGAADPTPKVARDIVAKEGDSITLGDTTIKLFVTPGHTPGCLTMEYTVYDNGKPYTALTLGGSGFPSLELLDVYMQSHQRMRALPGVEVMLSDHPYMADFYNLQTKLAQRKPGEPNPFVIGRQNVIAWYDAVLEAARRKQEYDRAHAK
jgi:metallo-beta-lactamase class B